MLGASRYHEHLRFSIKLYSYFLKTGTVLNDV